MADITTIGPQTHVQGAISGDGPLHIEGSVEGQVTLSEQLTVEPSGKVTGEVRVREAIVHGNLEGTLIASERVILTSSAHVTGHLEAPIIRMDDGARFTGEVEMVLDGAPPEIAASRVTTPVKTTSFTTPARPAAPAPTPAPMPAPVAKAPAAPSTQSSASTATQTETATTTVVVVDEEPEEELEQESEVVSDGEPTEYDDHTVKELREELRRRDLPVSGTKQELIERLVESSPVD